MPGSSKVGEIYNKKRADAFSLACEAAECNSVLRSQMSFCTLITSLCTLQSKAEAVEGFLKLNEKFSVKDVGVHCAKDSYS